MRKYVDLDLIKSVIGIHASYTNEDILLNISVFWEIMESNLPNIKCCMYIYGIIKQWGEILYIENRK